MTDCERIRTWAQRCIICGHVRIIESAFEDVVYKYLNCSACGASTVDCLKQIPTGVLAIGDEWGCRK